MRSALNSQQVSELTGGRRGIRNVPDVPYVSHLTHARGMRKEMRNREDFVANEQGEILPVAVRNDQLNTIKLHLDYTSARIAVDDCFSTELENGRILLLQPNSDFNVESQYCSAIHMWQIAVSGGRCSSVSPVSRTSC